MPYEQPVRVLLGIRNPRIRREVLLSLHRDSMHWQIECCKCEADVSSELISKEFDLVIVDYSSLGIRAWGLVGLVCDPGFPVLLATNENTQLDVSGNPYDCPAVVLIPDSDLAVTAERAKLLLPSLQEGQCLIAGKLW